MQLATAASGLPRLPSASAAPGGALPPPSALSPAPLPPLSSSISGGGSGSGNVDAERTERTRARNTDTDTDAIGTLALAHVPHELNGLTRLVLSARLGSLAGTAQESRKATQAQAQVTAGMGVGGCTLCEW